MFRLILGFCLLLMAVAIDPISHYASLFTLIPAVYCFISDIVKDK